MRTLSRLSAVALAVTLAFGVTSCSNDDPAPSPSPEPSASSTDKNDPTDSPTVNPTKKPGGTTSVICRDPKTLTPFTGAAVAKFGADEVMDAYCEMADFFYLNAVTGLTAPKDSYEAVELSWVKDWMSPEASSDWDAIVRDELKDLTDGDGGINRVTYFNLRGVEGEGYAFPQPDSGLPSMIGGGVGAASTKVSTLEDGTDALDVSFTVTTNVVIQKDGKDFAFPIEREVSLRLVPTGAKIADAHSWLIAGWNCSYSASDPEPLSKFAASKS